MKKEFDFLRGFGEIDENLVENAGREWKRKKYVVFQLYSRKIAGIAILIMICIAAMSNSKVQAAVKEFTTKIGEILGFEKDLSSYTETIEQTQTKNGISLTLKEAILDDRVLGSSQWEGGLDLFNIVLIGIASELPEHNGEYGLHRLLGAMLSAELSTDEKLGIMETEYNIPINDKMREDVNAMCNLSQGIREKGRAEGGTETEEKIIINMYTNNFTLEQIALATGRGIEYIRAVIEKKEPQMV